MESVHPYGFVTADDAIGVQPPTEKTPIWSLHVGRYSASGMTLYFRDLEDLRRLYEVIGEALAGYPGPDRPASAETHPQGTVIPPEGAGS